MPVSELGDLAVEVKNLAASVAAMKYRALIIRVLRTTPALELALTLESHRPARGGGGGGSLRDGRKPTTQSLTVLAEVRSSVLAANPEMTLTTSAHKTRHKRI